MNLQNLKILNFVLTWIIVVFDSIVKGNDADANSNSSKHYEAEIERIKNLYKNDNNNSILEKNFDLFLPKYDFQRPEKFKKETYSKIYKQVGEYKRRTETSKDIFIFPEEIIEENEIYHKKDLLDILIKKEVSLEELNYNGNYEIYGFPDAKTYQNEEPKFINLEDPNVKIKNFSEISDFISFEPKEMQINDKPICIPTMSLLYVKNTMNENLILRSIKSDLYQATIFYFRPDKDSSQSYNQKNVYPKTLQPGENMIFQLIILPDMVGRIKGNVYLEFNDSKIVIYPIVINAIENIYRVNPIYSPSWLGSKLLTTPITLYNPHSKTLIVKEVINSFSSINLVWPNGQPVSSNHTSISSSMLEIPPKTSKTVMMINFYKEVPGVEYGLLQMKTDKDTLIIPVLVRVEIQGIKTYPSYFNFGLIDLNRNVKRFIPITISNVHKTAIQIKSIFTNFEENMIDYIPNLYNMACPSYNHGQSFPNKDTQPSSNIHLFNSNYCVIGPGETHINFGYLMIDPNNYQPEINDSHLYKKIRGSLILQTNFTENQFTELFYEYYLDKNTFLPNNGNGTFKQFELFYEYGYSKYAYRYELEVKIKPPFTFSIASTILRRLENPSIPKISSIKNLKELEEISITPDNSKILTMYKEANDTLKLSIVIDNINNFENKKNYFYAVKTNLNLFTIIPVKFYDKSLDLHYCDTTPSYKECIRENYSIYKGVNYKNTIINIDFGLVSTSENAKKYFSILNDNNENIMIKDIETNKANLLLAQESIEDIFTNEKISNAVGKFQGNENEKLQKALRKKVNNNDKEKITLTILAGTYITFSVNINSSVEQDVSAKLEISFNNSKLIINVTAKFLKGNLNISPSVIRFEPAFPGFYQNKLVSSKSGYSIPINIHSIKSNDQRIIPVLLTNSIISNNRTEILKVIFDPSKVSLEENFMKGEFSFNITSRYLTYKELYLWKEKQKLWELLGSQGRTEINTSINIKTNIQSETLKVRAFLTKPSLVKKDEINFGLIQIGETVSNYIEVFNPSDEPMQIQVLLASEEFSDIYNNTMFSRNKKFRFTPDNHISIMECHFFNTSTFETVSSNFTQNLLSQKNQKRRKKKIDEDLGIDLSNSIIIEEEMDYQNISNISISKSEFMKKLFLYANNNVKNNFVSAERVVCNSNFMKKNEIILNNYKELTEKIFSDEFNKEINIIKKMSECPPPANSKKDKENNIGLFERIAQFLKIFFKTETPVKKRKSDTEQPRQYFFLPKIVSSQVYTIKPHQKHKVGPIIYHPSTLSSNSATLFIKNNLTILYPIKLKGDGGSGMVNFSVLERDRDPISNQTILREIKIEHKLLFDIDSIETLQQNNEIMTKTLKIKNTGNLPVRISNISIENSGCEIYGIKIHKCDNIFLKPEETHKLQISVKPDFNFYFIEKDLIFETQYQTIVLKISININNELLNMKNRLFNFDYLKNYGYISIFVVIFIVSVILYILSKEYAEMTMNNFKQPQNIQFISSKELIESNPVLKFENLYIKSYRKCNYSFYDDFMYKQLDKPGTGPYEIDSLGEKRKSGNKVTRDRRSEDVREFPVQENKDENIINQAKNDDESAPEGKDQVINQSTITEQKVTPSTIKKEAQYNKGKRENKKALSKMNPVGIGAKNEKKEIPTTLEKNQPIAKKQAVPSTSDVLNPSNKLDSYNQNPNSIYNKYGSENYTNVNKDEYYQANYENNYHNYDQNYPVDYSQGYWPKQYGSYYNKQQFQQRYEYGHSNRNNNAYYGKGVDNQNQNYYNSNVIGNPGQKQNISTYGGDNISKINSGKTSSTLGHSSGYMKNENNQQPIDKKGDDNLNRNNERDKIEENSKNKENIYGIPNDNNIKDKDNSKKLKEQFMNFRTDTFVKKEAQTTSSSKEVEKSNNQNVQNVEKKISSDDTNNKDLASIIGSSEDKNEEIPKNILKSNFDFSGIFIKPETIEQENGELYDNKIIQDEDGSSHNYQSEKEKFDSGTEDFKFNFNTIFGNSTVSKYMNNMNYANDTTDNEEKDSNKPYFNKFFNFDNSFTKPNSVVFSSNPFANASENKKSLLSELLDDDNNMDRENDKDERNKLDEVAENDDEDEEEDPLWNTDNVDIKKEGFFDETGTYKLKQIDFNFDLDFKLKK